jgi:hypothetical protein
MVRRMDALGRLGRDLFTALYDLRVPVAIGGVALVLALAVIAWRRGWFAAARRHPGRAAVAIALAAAIGGPLSWYLASPIWIRTSLVEAAPTSAPADVGSADPAPSAALVTPTAPPPSSQPSVGATATPTAFARRTVSAGTFRGTDDFHFGRGRASIIEIAPGRLQLRLDEFSVRNGPDLYVYLSTASDGYADDALELGKLKATDGSFGYELPAGTDPGRFRSAIIWCKQFSHLFAVARFEA